MLSTSGSPRVHLPSVLSWMLQNAQAVEAFACHKAHLQREALRTYKPGRRKAHIAMDVRGPSLVNAAVALCRRKIHLWKQWLCGSLHEPGVQQQEQERSKTRWQPRDAEEQVAEPSEGGIQQSMWTRGTAKPFPSHRPR